MEDKRAGIAVWARRLTAGLMLLVCITSMFIPKLGLAPAKNNRFIHAANISRSDRIRIDLIDRDSSSEKSAGVVTVHGVALRVAYQRKMVVTAYCPGRCCCGWSADGMTASGKSVYTNGMKLVASDLPFGTLVSVAGYHGGEPVPVLDRGRVIKGKRMDLLMPTHEEALRWGRRSVEVTVWEDAK